MKKTSYITVAAVLALLGLLWYGAQHPPEPAAPAGELYTVVRVVDGDTIDVDINGEIEAVRFIGIDAPESKYSYEPEECYGTESSAHARELLSRRKVRLEKDDTQEDRDTYGRLLRYVFRDDNLFINEHMVVEGYAREYTFKKAYRSQEQFRTLQVRAKNNAKGVWSADCI